VEVLLILCPGTSRSVSSFHGGDFSTSILSALEAVGDCEVPGTMGAWVAIGAAAPVLMKLSGAFMGRLLLTQPVKMATATTARLFAAGIFISIYMENAPLTVCIFTAGNWCQREELNLRPKAYESSALPLSYAGEPLPNERGQFNS
jgi:hypothetical protein